MAQTASALYSGRVMHQRLRPRAHRLSYRMFSLLLDIDEIDGLARRLRAFSRNRFNLFSFHDADFADGSGASLRRYVEGHLEAAGLPAKGGAIRLLSMPRILGYVFNPISVYYCHASDGALSAVLYEVNNTFGQRHSYLIPVETAASGAIEQSCDKKLYVSPFMRMDLGYSFQLAVPDERLRLRITASDKDGPVVIAAYSGKRKPLTDGVLLGAFFTVPLLTLKVVAGIHWEALRLWLKGVPLQPRPAAPRNPVTATAKAAPSLHEADLHV